MKTTRYFLAAALVAAAAACSADVTAPELRVPAEASASTSDTTNVAPKVVDESGWLGSGGG
jgi:hypothetical protein